MDRFKLTKQDRINQYKIIMYNVKGDLECYTRPNIVRRLDKMGFFDAPASINHHGAYSGALFAGLYGQDGLDVERCEKPLHCGYVPRSVQVR